MNPSFPGKLTIREALHAGESCLEEAGCAGCDAQYLLLALLGLNRAELFLASDRYLLPGEIRRYRQWLFRRTNQEPLQYIVGRAAFWSREFTVDPSVLIPRPETEFVLEQTLAAVRRDDHCPVSVLDMGTGSGVIADVLADELPGSRVLAVDCSFGALRVAFGNIRNHALQNRVSFLCSDLFTAIAPGTVFDLIVSNPPYVAERERPDLEVQVVDHEPSGALFAGSEGLDCYQRLVPESLYYLRPGGRLCLEIGAHQEHHIRDLLTENGYEQVLVRRDYAGNPRFATGLKTEM